MTAIIDGVTVIGTPEEINRLIELRGKTHSNFDVIGGSSPSGSLTFQEPYKTLQEGCR